MHEEQLALFKKKSFPAVQRQVITINKPTPETTILQTLPAYHDYLQGAGYSKYTPDDFTGDVKKLGFYLRDKQLQHITPEDIYQWIANLKEKEALTEKTISRKVTAICNYFDWLSTEHSIYGAPPTSQIRYGRVTSPLPTILFESECQQLYQVASQQLNIRAYLLVLLLLETGIKKEELLNLQVTDCDFSNKYAPEIWIKHTGKKWRKSRKLKLPQETVAVVTDYLSTYEITDRLFPYTMRFIQYILTDLAKAAGVKKKVTASILRDTFAVRCLNRGEGIDLVLQKLGLSESTWEDAKIKYLKLASRAL